MPNSSMVVVLALLAVSCVTSGGSPLRPVPRGSAVEEGHDENHEDAHVENHGAGAQALNLFVGGSSDIGDADGFTIGLDYEYRLSHRWGIGGFAESVSGLNRSLSLGLQAYWHAVGELILVAGPGVERRGDEWEPIARVGGFYEFPIGDGWILSPGVFYDITPNEDLLIYGLNLGFGF
ncbi:MAG: hypothetical protein ACI8QZ_000805 [Chlamydiales bacterium]|jgi:hypothetical protein